jgi:hypothetical protein
MIKTRILILFIFAFSLLSCGDSDLLEDYFVQKPRVLAIKVEAPEARPAEQVSMRILVGGRAIDQDMDTAVSWFFTDEQQGLVGTAGYDEALTVQVPANLLDDGAPWVDLPVLARLEIGSKALFGEKFVRITQDPIGKNPIINGVDIVYQLADERVTDQAFNGDQITIPSQVRNIALTASMEELAVGENDHLVFRWYVSTSKNSGGKLYLNVDKDVIGELLGPSEDASETKPSVVFSLRGKDAHGSLQTGLYDVYLVVRDNATAPQSAADDRLGTDFFYFTLCVGDASGIGDQ